MMLTKPMPPRSPMATSALLLTSLLTACAPAPKPIPPAPPKVTVPQFLQVPPSPAIVAPVNGAAVAVSEEDLRACDADYAYARAAHDWARGL